MELEAATLRWTDTHRRDVSQAWHGVVFYSQALAGKLPDLATVLGQGRQRQSMDQMRAQLTALLGTPRVVTHG